LALARVGGSDRKQKNCFQKGFLREKKGEPGAMDMVVPGHSKKLTNPFWVDVGRENPTVKNSGGNVPNTFTVARGIRCGHEEGERQGFFREGKKEKRDQFILPARRKEKGNWWEEKPSLVIRRKGGRDVKT